MFREDVLSDLKEEKKKFDEKTEKLLEKRPERKDVFYSGSGEEVKRVYTPLDIQEMNYNDDIGLPGEYPFTRGAYGSMHRGRLWTMRMYAGFATAEESNRRYKYLVEQGSSGLSVAFDLPTQIGYDSNHELANGKLVKLV